MIEINELISLKCFDKEEDEWVINEVNGPSKSDMIHQVAEHLLSSTKTEELKLGNAYLIVYDGIIVGYVLLNGALQRTFYLEYLIFKQYRHQGIGSECLDSIVDKIFELRPDIKECRLSIYKNNLPSMSAARNSFFYENEEDFDNLQSRIDFIRDNPYYKRITTKKGTH